MESISHQMTLITGNRVEILAQALAGIVKIPPDDPFFPEIIVVQSLGMQKWVSLELARHNGICANIAYLFPNALIDKLIADFFTPTPDQTLFDPLIMTFRLMKLLPVLLDRSEFASLKNYLKNDDGGARLFELCTRISDTFDQYLIFRPDMIFDWEKGLENHWQAILWHELVKATDQMHRAQLGGQLLKHLCRPDLKPDTLPERISIFGITSLPIFHMDILKALSYHCQINLFLLNPCQEYWGDVQSRHELTKSVQKIVRLKSPSDTNAQSAENVGTQDRIDQLYLNKGNALLSSMGILARDFFELIYAFDCQVMPLFSALPGTDLLSHIQEDILNLVDPGESGPEYGQRKILPTDRSVCIQACHSHMREVEILQDFLLSQFEQNPGLTPRDILIMAPDINLYTPYIQAVFGTPESDDKMIPFTISDRNPRKQGKVVDIFLSLLNLVFERMEPAKIMDILEFDPVMQMFCLTEQDIRLIHDWIFQTQIRWGIDASSKKDLDLPETFENTWRFGLDRLLLGYALSDPNAFMLDQTLAYEHIEGHDAQVLGHFMDFIENLFAYVKKLGKSRPLKDWSVLLNDILSAFFATSGPETDEYEDEIQEIRQIVLNMDQIQTICQFDALLSIQTILSHLGKCIEKGMHESGFISHGVTFCSMLPMRSIPARIICLLGMNYDAYPRQSKSVSFDLIARHPRPCDRSRRNDDRYLFLETLLSVRQTLYISYLGHSIVDNSPKPPSVLVSELIDYIEKGFYTEKTPVINHILTNHRLFGFHPDYFKDPETEPAIIPKSSYSQTNYAAAQNMLEPPSQCPPLITVPLDEPGEEFKTIDIQDLCYFFKHPVKFLLSKRLGIILDQTDWVLEEAENFELDFLDQAILKHELLEQKLQGRDLNAYFPVMQGQGKLPHGALGQHVYRNLCQTTDRFFKALKPHLKGPPLPDCAVYLELDDFTITGRLKNLYQDYRLTYGMTRINATKRIEQWICHLVLNCLDTPGIPHISKLIGFDPVAKSGLLLSNCTPTDQSRSSLLKLLDLYWQGLKAPLHFFPSSSYLYALNLYRKNKTPDACFNAALNLWQGSTFKSGECEDAYYRFCFRETSPIDETFAQISLAVFQPFFDCQEDQKP